MPPPQQPPRRQQAHRWLATPVPRSHRRKPHLDSSNAPACCRRSVLATRCPLGARQGQRTARGVGGESQRRGGGCRLSKPVTGHSGFTLVQSGPEGGRAKLAAGGTGVSSGHQSAPSRETGWAPGLRERGHEGPTEEGDLALRQGPRLWLQWLPPSHPMSLQSNLLVKDSDPRAGQAGAGS